MTARPFAGPISTALLDHSDPGLARLAVLGLWTLTLWEYALTLLRVDERARAYFLLTVANVLATIPVTVVLVVAFDQGAAGILLGTYGTGAVFLVYQLWRERRRLGGSGTCSGRSASLADLGMMRGWPDASPRPKCVSPESFVSLTDCPRGLGIARRLPTEQYGKSGMNRLIVDKPGRAKPSSRSSDRPLPGRRRFRQAYGPAGDGMIRRSA